MSKDGPFRFNLALLFEVIDYFKKTFQIILYIFFAICTRYIHRMIKSFFYIVFIKFWLSLT